MKKLTNLLLTLTLIINFSCSKTNDDTDNSQNEGLEAQFIGNMITGSINNEVVGKVYITETGNFTLESFSGRITGNAELENDIYTITNISGDGAFESSTFTNGQLNLNNLNLNLNGNYIDSNPILINGGVQVFTGEELEQIWSDARTKSSVIFSHNELCSASITIDNITLENLGTHYNETGAFCDQSTYGELMSSKLHLDVDNSSSKTICNTVTLYDPITGEYNTSEWCVSSWFVVDKNTEYTYTVNWDNGYSYTDTFTSADGGQGVTICPTNPLEDCDTNDDDDDGPFQEIIENTLIIDYANSNTIESGEIEFSNENYLCEMINNQLVFGEQWESGSYFSLGLNNYEAFQEGVYQLGELPDQLFAFIQINPLPDGIQYYQNPTGTVQVTFLDIYPEFGGEVHLELNNVRLENGNFHIYVSGTLKATWE